MEKQNNILFYLNLFFYAKIFNLNNILFVIITSIGFYNNENDSIPIHSHHL